MKKIEKEIADLIKKINEWDKKYFEDDSPLVSDRVYDTQLKKLSNLEKKYPEFLKPNSPTNKIGSNLKNKFNKVSHNKRMLSLDKAYSIDDINKFMNDILKVTKDKKTLFFLEPKIDGLSISLIYRNGNLTRAITRGDGNIGEDVTDNIFDVISDIPTSIKYKKNLEVRGEIFISKSNFEEIKNTNINFSNPRNFASGTLRQINKQVAIERKLSCFIYELVSPEDHLINTLSDSILFLKDNSFRTIDNSLLTNNIDIIINYIQKFEKTRNELDYETDGLVVKLNDIIFYKELGFTSKFPKYNIAYKFDDELVETKLIGITPTIGRTGMVTYNAQLEPVLLKGTTVSAATLHNFNYINKLNINIGDDVMIKKAGEIIPKVFSLSKKHSKTKFQKITICPFCNSEFTENILLTNQFCNNSYCPEVNIRKIIHFTSRKAMDISGLGESWIRIFFADKIINKISDIYLLNTKQDQIKSIKRVGDKSISNLLRSIEKSKEKDLSSVIFALGINHLGERSSEIIASKIITLDNFPHYNFAKLDSVKDIGPTTLTSIIEYQKRQENIDDINQMIFLGINPTYKNANDYSYDEENFFNNKNFVITGTFPINRNELKNIIEKNGGKILASISNTTNYLICGNDFGSKKSKADEKDIEIIYSDRIMELIKHI
ncbi:MAG: NAD-dependent DNA ligase LigA [Mycoplasmataceae bacterium]|nr:NAD-dependent DNA ligase LigA [Mycoplasmataceae bacterium]